MEGNDPLSGLGPSCWLDVRGTSAQNKVVPEEMAVLERCLRSRFATAWPRNGKADASLCVISPFVAVEREAGRVARSVLGRDAWRRCPTGTVHRFQGQEKDVVFLVLGSAPGEAGSRSRAWASARANLLNVAVTRARWRLYVIGNMDDWSSCPHFSELAQEFWSSGRVSQMELAQAE